jgi:hypothetical protein
MRHVESQPSEIRLENERLLAWAQTLENEGVARLVSYRAPAGFATLLPYLLNEPVGLVTIDSYGNFSPWRSVFERRAPTTIGGVETSMAPVELGAGRSVKRASQDLLDAVRDAYYEAAGKRLPSGTRDTTR